MSTMDQMVEAGARALCAAEIRIRRRWDTEPDVMERMLPAAVDYAWNNYVQQAEAAIRAALPILGEELVKIASAPGFIQARDTEWDEGVNFTKRFVAEALRYRLSEIMEGK